MALMPWDYDPNVRGSFGIPQQNQVDRGFGLVFDDTGWEVDPTSGVDRSTMRKKATPDDLIKLKQLANSFIDPNQGGEGNPDPWLVLYDMTGIEYDPSTGYIYSSKGPTPGTGGGAVQSFLPIVALVAAMYGANALGGALGAGATAGEIGAGATGGAAGATGAGATTAGTGAAGTSAGLGLDATLSGAAGGNAALAGTSGAGVAGTTAGGITYGDILKGALAVAPAVIGATANTGGTPVSATSTTTNLPTYMQAGAQQTWDDYINTFYGLQGGKSYKSMLDEDTQYKQTQGNKLSTLLQSLVDQGTSGTGMFTPTNVSFGGNKVFSFVPKSNRNLANQLAALQGANYDLSTDLAPNKASTDYLDKLFTVITALNPQSNTQTTQQTTTPTTSTWANILQGLTQGTNIYNALNSGSSSNVKMVQNADGTYSVVKA